MKKMWPRIFIWGIIIILVSVVPPRGSCDLILMTIGISGFPFGGFLYEEPLFSGYFQLTWGFAVNVAVLSLLLFVVYRVLFLVRDKICRHKPSTSSSPSCKHGLLKFSFLFLIMVGVVLATGFYSRQKVVETYARANVKIAKGPALCGFFVFDHCNPKEKEYVVFGPNLCVNRFLVLRWHILGISNGGIRTSEFVEWALIPNTVYVPDSPIEIEDGCDWEELITENSQPYSGPEPVRELAEVF